VSARRARAALGRAYARAWQRGTPQSARATPRLPDHPLSRRFGQDRGRPIDRVYIEGFLADHAADIRGRGLEIYEPTYLERFGSCTQIDVLDADPAARRATIRGDLSALPAQTFDVFILTQTLQAVADPLTALRHAHAALRPGGVLLATVPGITMTEHGVAFPDHVRFTAYGLEALAGQVFASPQVATRGNLVTAAAFLYGMAEHELDPAQWRRDDPAYEVVITLRAARA
jgi:SAM-dependent methyltransferase